MHNVMQLHRLQKHFADELVIIGVHSAKFPSEKLTANIFNAVRQESIQHPVVNDAGFKIWGAYAVHAWPTVVLIDPNGKIIGSRAGEIIAEDFIPLIEKIIEQYNRQGTLRKDIHFSPSHVV